MKRASLLLVVVLALVASPAASLHAGETHTLKGEFVWSNRDRSGGLEAVFTPVGERKWEVSFHFTFRGADHVYSGTAEGSLSEGELSGSVQNENQRRTFTFSGEFKDGRFSGTHAEIDGAREQQTGTLTLG